MGEENGAGLGEQYPSIYSSGRKSTDKGEYRQIKK